MVWQIFTQIAYGLLIIALTIGVYLLLHPIIGLYSLILAFAMMFVLAYKGYDMFG